MTLNRDGVPAPRGRAWGSTTIWAMLRDTHYIGEWSYGKRRNVRRQGNKVVYEQAPEDEVIRQQRPELAIVSPDIWKSTQALLPSRKRDMPAPLLVGAAFAAVHPLSGVLHCGQCGARMARQTRSGAAQLEAALLPLHEQSAHWAVPHVSVPACR